MFIVNVGYLDAPKFSDRCFETFRCRSIKDVSVLIDTYISRKRYVSVRIAEPSDEHMSLWPLFEGDVL